MHYYRFELETRGFELVTRGFEPATRGFELLTRGFELVTRGFELVTRNSCFTFPLLLDVSTTSFFMIKIFGKTCYMTKPFLHSKIQKTQDA